MTNKLHNDAFLSGRLSPFCITEEKNHKRFFFLVQIVLYSLGLDQTR